MTEPDPTAGADPSPAPAGGGARSPRSPAGDRSGGRVGTLRGAGVDVDVRTAGRVVLAAVLAALAVLAAILFVAGMRKNAQVSELRTHGVPVTVTVTGCLGLLGGSGSNAASYSCHGSFELHGRRYRDDIPGTALHAPGSTLRAVTVASDPSLLATVGGAAADRPSWRVFLLPAILLALLLVLVGALSMHRRGHPQARRRRRAAPPTGGG